MPLQVELEPQRQCSFFSFCSLDDVTVGENGVTQQLIDVWIDASTLSRHNQSMTTSLSNAISDPSQVATMLRPEQHFYPSSMAFDLICLLDQGFVHASHLGLQRKVRILCIFWCNGPVRGCSLDLQVEFVTSGRIEDDDASSSC